MTSHTDHLPFDMTNQLSSDTNTNASYSDDTDEKSNGDQTMNDPEHEIEYKTASITHTNAQSQYDTRSRIDDIVRNLFSSSNTRRSNSDPNTNTISSRESDSQPRVDCPTLNEMIKQILMRQVDPFELLVRCICTVPFQQPNAIDHVIAAVHLCFTLQMFFCIWVFETDSTDDSFHQWCISQMALMQTESNVYKLVNAVFSSNRQEQDVHNFINEIVKDNRFSLFMLPFLRRTTILLAALSKDMPHFKLNQPAIKISDVQSPLDKLNAELNHLLSVCYLPSREALPNAQFLHHSLMNALTRTKSISYSRRPCTIDPYCAVHLVELPHSYDSLFQQLVDSSVATCSRCSNRPKFPALCLLTGELLCAQSSCCQRDGKGELSQHTFNHSPSGCLFLMVKQCAIMLLGQGLALQHGSIYVDEFEETDILLRRGKPLHLSQQRLEQLRSLLAKNGEMVKLIARIRNQLYAQECIARNSF